MRARRHTWILVLALAVSVAGLLMPAAANAQGLVPFEVNCGGGTVTVLTQPSQAEQSWGAVQVVGDGTLIPLAFSFSAYDVTQDMLLFSDTDVKGGGKVPPGLAGSVTTCSFTDTDTLGNLLEPGEEPPPGTSLTDIVTLTFEATVAVRP